MLSRKLINSLNLRVLRFGNASSNAAQYKSLRKDLTRHYCPKQSSSTFHTPENQFLPHGNRFEEKEKESGGYTQFITKISKFIPAFILISLFGIKEAFCSENSIQNANSTDQSSKLVEKSSIRNLDSDTSTLGTATSKSNDIAQNTPVVAPKIKSKDQITALTPTKEDEKSEKNEDFPKQENDTDKIVPGSPSEENKSGAEELPPPIPRSSFEESPLTLKNAVESSRSYLNRKMTECGAPGVAIAVSVNGKNLWAEGIGYSDVENCVRMSPYSVLRIASISKSLTMTAVCQLVEEGKLDLDAPIQKYVPLFPKKVINGEEVTITTRHLLNHTSGIRHYKLKDEIKLTEEEKKQNKEDEVPVVVVVVEEEVENEGETEEERKAYMNLKVEKKRQKLQELITKKAFKENKKEVETEDEFDLKEYHIKEEFESIEESLHLFQDDDLLFKPGEDYNYSTHGWTLVSAVVEAAGGRPFTKIMLDLFRDLGLQNTFLDQYKPIIYRRARYYYRDHHGRLKNSPYVDCSYKWAGGGLLSNVIDLTKFGNAMLYSYQVDKEEELEGFLKADTMRKIWAPSQNTNLAGDNRQLYLYGLGWGVMSPDKPSKAFACKQKTHFSHTGGAIGCSSVLLIVPTGEAKTSVPQGVVVTIITNMQSVGLHQTALKIASIFERVHQETKVVGSIRGNATSKVYRLEKL